MSENSKWAIWKDDNSEFILGPFNLIKNNQLIEEFENFEEGRKAWKFYTLFLINK
jgi:hypothetical protein